MTTPTSSANVLTLPLARQVLFLSFWLSQGDSGFQRLLFGWLHLARPAWRVDNVLVEPLIAQVTRAAQALLARGGHAEVAQDIIAREVRTQASHLQEELASSLSADQDTVQQARQEALAACLRMLIARSPLPVRCGSGASAPPTRW